MSLITAFEDKANSMVFQKGALNTPNAAEHTRVLTAYIFRTASLPQVSLLQLGFPAIARVPEDRLTV